MMRLHPLHVLTAIVGCAAPLAAMADTTPAPITGVVELFTSEGCSSCPPADALMKTYAKRDGILALSFNVDYWDNLGWKDTLASPKYSQRQRAYARARGDGQVYTPQAVINGASHAVGSDATSIDQELKSTAAQFNSLRIPVSVTADGDGISIAAPAGANGTDATVWLVKFTPEVEVAIQRGENSGRSIAYHNSVHELTAVGRWTGDGGTTHVPGSALTGCTLGTCAILLQGAATGPILGAAWVPGRSGI